MRALVKSERGPGHLELRDDWPSPHPGPGWVVVDVTACGICGTDLHIWHDEHKNFPPVVLGHEYVGRVASLGPGVQGWSVGDRVVCEQHTLACGHCHSCRRGAIHLCPDKRSPGWGIDGAFADQVALPASLLHRVADGVPDDAAVTTEPLAICLTGIDRGEVRAGEVALVVGPGPLGILCSLALKAAGTRVLLAGRPTSQARLDLAGSLGVPTVTATAEAVGARLSEFADDRGADVVFEASGSEDGLALAVRASRRQGRVVCVGFTETDHVLFPAREAMTLALDVRFSMSSEYSSWDRALTLLALGAVDPRPLVRAYPLEAWREAFGDLAARQVVKAVLRPGPVTAR
ncbi:MAG TPA: alcohol dehydrogenase catalytic domain-containing protein [Acidimicrobiales bacterium]|nr:alcohol dehydrogenase catalytic domain-containing protein [Acidimicrobiales bacterium]